MNTKNGSECSPWLAIQKTSESTVLHIERQTGNNFCKDLDSDDNPYKVVPYLLPGQLISSLK